MDKEVFKNYIKDRYEQQIEYYSKKSELNKRFYISFQISLIVFSSLTPVLIGIAFCSSDLDLLKWIPIVTSVLVAIIAGVLKVCSFHENWINFRTTCETLKKEIHFFKAGVGEYENSRDKEALFVERVESLISRENTLWFVSQKRDGKNKKT